MYKIRLRYSKTGKAKFISHLDLMSVMRSAFLRAGIGLSYSKGFNPHPYMSVALPLPVGCGSICELLDVGLTDDVIPDINSITLPEGIAIEKAYKPVRRFSEIAWVEISGILHYDKSVDNDIINKLENSFAGDNIIISKRTKREQKDINIAPFIKNVKFSANEIKSDVTMTAMISAVNPTLNTVDLLNALDKTQTPVHNDMKRIDIYDSGMLLFN